MRRPLREGSFDAGVDVYIGRGCREHPPSVWGNPFKLGRHTRADAVQKFEQHLLRDGSLLGLIPTLEGKVLRCHCTRDDACHGDVIVSVYNRLFTGDHNKGNHEPDDHEKGDLSRTRTSEAETADGGRRAAAPAAARRARSRSAPPGPRARGDCTARVAAPPSDVGAPCPVTACATNGVASPSVSVRGLARGAAALPGGLPRGGVALEHAPPCGGEARVVQPVGALARPSGEGAARGSPLRRVTRAHEAGQAPAARARSRGPMFILP